MIIRRPPDIPSSEITPESVYVNRRKFLAAAGLGVAGAALGPRAVRAFQDEDDQEVTSTFPPKAVTIRANIRRVLGEVLEQLDDDDDHFSVPGYI